MLKIAGVQKTSLIDYPERIVSTLFTQGCNLRCPYCHNSDLVPLENKNHENNFFRTEELLDFLSRRKALLDGVCITGGEPTIQKGVIDFIRSIKELGFLVKLDTNGTNPEILGRLLSEGLLDYLAMDIKAPLEKYQEAAGRGDLGEELKETISLITGSAVSYEFRTTIVPGLHRTEDIAALGVLIKGAGSYYLQNFRPVNTLDPDYMQLSPFPPAKLAEFKEAVSPYVKKVEIRG